MSGLTAAQKAAIKKQRAKAWTRPFDLKTYPAPPDGDYYDEPVGSPTVVSLLGDYTWRDQMERRGAPGGVIDRSDLLLCTDMLHSGAMAHPQARLVVEGHEYAIKALTPYEDFGEVVVAGVRVI